MALSVLTSAVRWLARPAWSEVAAGCLIVAAAAGLVLASGRTTTPQVAILWAGWLVLAVVLLRQGWLKLCGPVLFYDLVRTARRGRYLIVRVAYPCFLLLLLFCDYLLWFLGSSQSFWDRMWAPALSSGEMGDFTASFFYIFTFLQLTVIFFLTPAYTAGAIAEEIERRTLEDLFATDLRNREIVLSLFLSRLANLVMVFLAGLPLLSAIQFLGGVDPSLVLATFAFSGLTLIALAALSMFFSLRSRKPREAVIQTYGVVFLYLFLSGFSWILMIPGTGWSTFPSNDDWTSPIMVADVVGWFSLGNVFATLCRIAYDVGHGGKLDELLVGFLESYAFICAVITMVCCSWVILRLRVAILQPDGAVAKDRAPLTPLLRPGIWRRPVLWKELFVEAGKRSGLLGRLGAGAMFAVLMLPALQLFFFFDRWQPISNSDRFGELLSLWVRAIGAMIGCLLLLQVAIRAAGTISRERDQQTLDGLLATPLRNQEILGQKWWGCFLSPRGLLVELALVWTIGLITRTLHPAAIPSYVLAWMVYAAFLAALGLWFSTANRTTRHATFGTLFAIGTVMTISFLLVYDLIDTWLPPVLAYSVQPPVALALLGFSPEDWAEYRQQAHAQSYVVPLGLGVWTFMTFVLWKLANIRFVIATGRKPEPRDRADWLEPTPTSGLTPFDLVKARGVTMPLPPPRRQLLRRFRNSLGRLAVFLIPVVLLAGWFTARRSLAYQELAAVLAEADRLDPGWQIEELEARRPVIPEEENSALVAMTAYQQMPSAWPDIRDMDKLLDQPPPNLLPPEAASHLRSEMERARDALATAARLKDMPRGRIPFNPSEDGVSTLLPHTQEMRNVANMLQYNMRLRNQLGDTAGALDSTQGILNLARAIGEEPTLISVLVRIALEQVSVNALERVLAQGEPDPTRLLELQRLYEDEIKQPLLLHGMRGERALMDRAIRSMQAGKGAFLGMFFSTRAKGSYAVPTGEELAILVSASAVGHRAVMLREYNSQVEICKLPLADQAAAFTQINKQLTRGMTPLIIRMLLPATTRIYDAVLRTTASQTCAITAIAAERYRRAKGHWPTTLADLVPDYLGGVTPIDPYSQKPICLKVTPDGLVVYSVGQDRIDNGGSLNRQRNGQPGLDLGMELWNPDRRRQPPRPLKKDNEL